VGGEGEGEREGGKRGNPEKNTLISTDSRYAAPAAGNDICHGLQQISCTPLLLLTDGTDRQTDTVPLHRRSLLGEDSVNYTP